jgi:Cdc6-like AAA superfamily ATPase
MTRSRHSILLNAFRPAREVDDPDFFAGRAVQLAQLTDSLHTIGGTPIIYGDRGLGKTSLAVQIRYIAMGDDELLDSSGLQDRALGNEDQYLTFFVTCTDATQDFDGLVQLLINEMEDADFTEIGQESKAKRLTERTVSHKVSLKAFAAESIRRYEREKSRPSYQELSRTEKLQRLIKIVAESYSQPVLVIIDEVDRLRSTKGLASFIKATSSESVKFILVGIATNISSLLSDHQSLERSLFPVRVPLMNEGELYEIVEKAEAYLRDEGVDIRFDHYATLKIVELAAGYPWFVHVLGQSALLLAAGEERDLVVEADAHLAVETIYGNQFAQQFDDMYRGVVRNSYQREMVFRAFAEWRGLDIPTSDIYRMVKTLGITNPSVYKGQLSSREYGRVLHTPQPSNRAWVRFSNEMFKVYVRMRSSIYVGVAEKVREAMNKYRAES